VQYVRFNLGDYAKKTNRLSFIEHGAYTQLMWAIYDRERFPKSLEEAVDWLWPRDQAERDAIELILARFFEKQPEGAYTNNRLREELEKYQEFCLVQSARGKKGGRPKKPGGLENKPGGLKNKATGKRKKSLTTNHYPLTTNHIEREAWLSKIPEGLIGVVNEFILHCDSLDKPITSEEALNRTMGKVKKLSEEMLISQTTIIQEMIDARWWSLNTKKMQARLDRRAGG
jgi:uncharacterized protein YdaU (DUF1376 family)